MKRTLISQVKKSTGKSVKISGFIEAIRDQGSIVFILLRDITGKVQIVVSKEKPELLKTVRSLTIESVTEIEGLVKEEKQAPEGVEITPSRITVLSSSEAELPIPVFEKGEETELQKRLDYRWLDLRKPEKQLIFKVWTTMEQAFREFCISEGFIEIHSPKITVTSTESGSELFKIKYFEREAYLVQSPQLYKQMAMAAGFEKVFEVGPVFRANPSFTSRHDTEFTMYDVELSYLESHHDLFEFEERMIQAIIKAIVEKYGEEIEKVYKRKLVVPSIPFPRIPFWEAKTIVKKLGTKSEKENDFSPEEERVLGEYILKERGNEFVFVYDYPTAVRAFYGMRHEENPSLSKTFDLLFDGLEITSGAQREHRYDQLKKQIIEKGFRVEPFESYLSFFKYGCPPHGGFAPGPTRMLMKIFNISNVREVTYLYRGVNRLTP